jgi:hypothetical protein
MSAGVNRNLKSNRVCLVLKTKGKAFERSREYLPEKRPMPMFRIFVQRMM